MNKKVLILGVAAVQMDAMLQLKKMGYEVHACAMAKDGPGVDVADFFEEINILDLQSVEEYILKNDIALVYSVGSDLAIPVASFLSEKLSLPRFVTEETAKICNNKNLMRETLGNGFVGNIAFQIISSIEDVITLPYPFILKPTDSQGQRGVVLVHDYEEFKSNYETSRNYSRSGLVIIEQYITGPEISVNGYVVDGEIEFLVASDRETWPQYTGLIRKHILPSESINSENETDLKFIMESACKKLGINNGPVYAQMKVENNKPYIIEITPRLDGCHMWNILEKYTGVNLMALTFSHLLNQDTSLLEKPVKIEKNYTLEFVCQAPHTKADYSEYAEQLANSVEQYKYYEEGQLIRPVNGKHEKIGYFIY